MVLAQPIRDGCRIAMSEALDLNRRIGRWDFELLLAQEAVAPLCPAEAIRALGKGRDDHGHLAKQLVYPRTWVLLQ